jgi:hypothetical protein
VEDSVPSTFRRGQGARFRCTGAIASVIAACGGGPMRMCQIHEAVEELLGRHVPRSTIKMALLTRRFERTRRGVYGLASRAALD